eukprot:3088498-Prymnesium_polylepis.1
MGVSSSLWGGVYELVRPRLPSRDERDLQQAQQAEVRTAAAAPGGSVRACGACRRESVLLVAARGAWCGRWSRVARCTRQAHATHCRRSPPDPLCPVCAVPAWRCARRERERGPALAWAAVGGACCRVRARRGGGVDDWFAMRWRPEWWGGVSSPLRAHPQPIALNATRRLAGACRAARLPPFLPQVPRGPRHDGRPDLCADAPLDERAARAAAAGRGHRHRDGVGALGRGLLQGDPAGGRARCGAGLRGGEGGTLRDARRREWRRSSGLRASGVRGHTAARSTAS